MPVEDPGTMTVRCDGCETTTEMDTTEYTNGGLSGTFGIDEQTLNDNGWTAEGSDTFCTECTESRKEEE